MPFVLAPNLWRLVTQRVPLESESSERAHGDGIMVDFDSPESFEEVFWQTFDASTSDGHSHSEQVPTEEVMALFAEYRALVANPRSGQSDGKTRRYLSKNNNNLLRLRTLAADSTARVLVVYRNPIATARSLHRLHRGFCLTQSENPFMRRYMGWLGHYEFGMDHRPFPFAIQDHPLPYDPSDLNYWLAYWTAVHQYLLRQSDLPLVLVCHDELRRHPCEVLGAVFDSLGVQADPHRFAHEIAPPVLEAESSVGLCPRLLEAAQSTYCTIRQNPANVH